MVKSGYSVIYYDDQLTQNEMVGTPQMDLFVLHKDLKAFAT